MDYQTTVDAVMSLLKEKKYVPAAGGLIKTAMILWMHS